VLIKASPKYKVIIININRVWLFNYLTDVVTTPIKETIPTTNTDITPTVSQSQQWRRRRQGHLRYCGPNSVRAAEIPTNWAPSSFTIGPTMMRRQLANQPRPKDKPTRGTSDASGLTGNRTIQTHTGSRGLVVDLQPIPRRPAEYKPAPKRKWWKYSWF
jgi:hypothetical protein